MYVPTFVLLTRLTPEGRRSLKNTPERMLEVNDEVGQMGCRVVRQYATLGQYDFVTVIEAPDNETVALLSIALGARGTLQVTSLAAAPMGEYLQKLRGPAQLGHG